ncbi:MAG: integrin alpha [Planctomycetota bacterium]
MALDGGRDINGDGVPDFLVGDPTAQTGGMVDARSGTDGSLIHRFYGTTANERFGESLAIIGDVDGDGLNDIVIGSPGWGSGLYTNSGALTLFSGLTGHQIRFHGGAPYSWLGTCVSYAGDSDGDGIEDYAAGAPGAGRDGEAIIFSGANGIRLATGSDWASYSGSASGSSLAFAGDFYGTGTPHVVYGSPWYEPYEGAFGGAVSALSADGGWNIASLGYAAPHMGTAVDGIPDIDGDGRDDILVSIPGYDEIRAYGASPWPTMIYRARGLGIGDSVVTVGDLDLDGIADFVAEGYYDDHGQRRVGGVMAYSGVDGSDLFTMRGFSRRGIDGAQSPLGDLDGDGHPEFLLSAPNEGLPGRVKNGLVYVYTYYPGLALDVQEVSASVGGAVQLQVDFPDSMAGQSYQGLMAREPGKPLFGYHVPLQDDALLADFIQGSLPPAIYVGLQGTLDALGDATISITVPAGVYDQHVGKDFWFSVVALPSGNQPARSTVARSIQLIP